MTDHDAAATPPPAETPTPAADDAATPDASTAKPRKPRRSSALTIVTTSEIQSFRDCANKHHFRYRERLRPMTTGKALAIGSIFHNGMSAGLTAGWWRPDPAHNEEQRDADRKAFNALTVDERLARQIAAATANVDAQVFEWVQEVVQYDPNADYVALQAFSDDAGTMIKFMLTNYFELSKRDLTDLVLVDTEKPFAVPVRDAIGRKTRLEFHGVRDALFYDPVYNALELHEHKTVGNLPEDIGKRAEMDPQTSGYMYALVEDRNAGRLKFPDGTPVPADAMLGRIAYNAVRKKLPSTPKVNKDGSVSVAAIDTTVELYMAALDEQQKVRNIPVTDKQLEKLHELKVRGQTYFGRVEYQKTRAEIERWRSDTLVDASRIRGANTNPALRTRNPGNCNMAWSMKCEYRSVCLDDTPETRAMFRVLADAHPEIREAESAELGAAVTTT